MSRPSRPRPNDTAPSGTGEADAPQGGGADLEQMFPIRVYREDLLPEDVTVLDGIPVTKPARTLLDLATVSDDRELEGALTEALRRGLTNRSEILAVIARYPRHRGGSRLRALIEAWSRRRRS